MNPAAEGQPEVFAIRRGEANLRLDVHHHYPIFSSLESSIKSTKSYLPISKIIQFSKETWDQHSYQGKREFPYIEISRVGLGTNSYEVIYIPLDEAPSRAKMVVRSQDILISTTRPHRGAIAEVPKEHDGFIASTGFAIARDIKDFRIQRSYLAAVLTSSIVLNQMLKWSSGGNYPAITENDIQKILIPIPDSLTQSELTEELEAALVTRQCKLAQADELLAGLDAFVLNTLGLKTLNAAWPSVFATNLNAVINSNRLNADYFHPERVQTIRMMQSASNHLYLRSLSQIAIFVRERTTVQQGDTYIGLADVQSHTGELLPTEQEVSGTAYSFRENDVLFARLRPYLNKVLRTEFSGKCSTEFHIIRVKKSKSMPFVLPTYLATILRSSLILAQTQHMMTGNTHPRLTNDDVINLMIPIPEPSIQQLIISEEQSRRDHARRLRKEAESEWADAKTRFEAQLLGEAN